MQAELAVPGLDTPSSDLYQPVEDEPLVDATGSSTAAPAGAGAGAEAGSTSHAIGSTGRSTNPFMAAVLESSAYSPVASSPASVDVTLKDSSAGVPLKSSSEAPTGAEVVSIGEDDSDATLLSPGGSGSGRVRAASLEPLPGDARSPTPVPLPTRAPASESHLEAPAPT
jgi:hypothetical protein